MPRQTTFNMFEQRYTQTECSFSIPKFTLALYTLGGNGRTFRHARSSYYWGCRLKAMEIPRTRASPSVANIHFIMISATYLHIFCRVSWLHGGATTESGLGRSRIRRRALGATDGAEGHLHRRALKAVTECAEDH
jgi:hypothetical protein